MAKIEMINKKFGRLLVKKEIGKSSDGSFIYECECECGNTHIANGCKLRDGSVKSCGCLQKELLSKRSKKIIKWEIIDANTVKGTTNNLDGIDFYIDYDDFIKCKDICWCAQYSEKSHTYYIHGRIGSYEQCEYLHRYILGLSKEDFVEVDHKDHDGTNNTKKNLRIGSRSKNAMNMSKFNITESGYHGVCWNEKINKWVVEIWENKNRRYLGAYSDLNVAIKIRKEAEDKYYKDWSYKNSTIKGVI